jgi:hypothetical protein
MRTVPPRLTARPTTTALGPNAHDIPGASGSGLDVGVRAADGDRHVVAGFLHSEAGDDLS